MVSEVANLRPIHSLPHRRTGVVLGLANVRGELLVCVSLGQVLGAGTVRRRRIGRLAARAHRRLLVIRRDDVRVRLSGRRGARHSPLSSRELQEVPATVAKATATYSKAMLSWNGHSVGLLDDQLLFYTLKRSLA